jgi:hypothetical protein
MPKITKAVVAIYLLFNVLIALTLTFDPSQLDAAYGGGEMTPTREFLWFSISSLHLTLVGITVMTFWMKRAAERRWILFVNAGFYLWDAVTQWAYWGARTGIAPMDLHVNAGVSAVTAAVVIAAALHDRDQPTQT